MNSTGMMNDAGGWMDRWLGPEMWVYTVTGVLLVVLLLFAILRLVKK